MASEKMVDLGPPMTRLSCWRSGRAARGKPFLVPVRTQHLPHQRRDIAGNAPGRDADGPCHGADTGVPQADLHGAGVRRLRDEVDAILECRLYLESDGSVQGIR